MKKIDIDNQEITNQEALKHKDFEKVMNKYSAMKTPFYKSPYFGGGVIGLLIIASYFIFSTTTKNTSKVYSNSSYSTGYNSPIDESIAFENIEGVVNSEKELIITSSSGTRITIPTNTLVDSVGNLIAGVVTFKYREFLDQKDIFLSGIPMNYDSADTKMNFESGGMFELLAYQNNKPVFINSEKSVQVELASKQAGNNFNIYYYSSDDNKWVYKSKDEAGFSNEEILAVGAELKKNPAHMSIQELREEKVRSSSQLKKLKKSKPIQPKLANTNKYNFTINVDYRDFPELTSFKGLKFQVSNKAKNFKPEYAQETWDDVDITHGLNRTEYNTCFTNKQQGKVCFITNPVFAKNDLATAEVLYDKLLLDYKLKKDSSKKRDKAIRKEIAKRSSELNDQRIVELNKRAVNLATVVENRITRTFQIENFGVWNSDCPQKLPSEAIVKANFVDESGKELQLGTMYLVLKGRNEVVSMTPEIVKEGIRYNPEEECMLWAVTSDRKNVAIFRANQFKEIKDSDESFTFEMNLISSKEFVTYSTETVFNL
ncbi:MAG: hypothetical protein COB15_05510 [Flavobacteriales bacterium]|nr:MAG: hypothetical protein COB15_05510 [Flavobacteriales bacterium]